jgi:hypothetical protein
MPEKPFALILDRQEAKKHVVEYFKDQVKLLCDLPDYGSNLIIRAFKSSKKDLSDVVVCGVLLRQVVAMLDAVQILVEQGAVHAAFLPARTAFEASIYLDWILLSDADRKARCYIVSNLRDERLWASRAIKGTQEEAAFNSITKSLDRDIHSKEPALAIDAKKHLTEVNRILAQPEFKEIDFEFNQQKGRRKTDLEWYKLFGAKSIRQVAQEVGRLPEYELYYAKSSQITHSASYKDHIRFMNKQVRFKQIRNLQGLDMLISFVVCVAIKSFQNVLRYYRPDELLALSKKYIEEWRTPFLSMTSVEYKL